MSSTAQRGHAPSPREPAHPERIEALVGRARELAIICDRLHTGQHCLVLGTRGTGKTRLLKEGMRSEPDRLLGIVRGSAVGRGVPLGALERHVPPSVVDVRTAVAHLRRTWGGRSGPDAHVRGALVVDDAHLLDDMSAFALRALAEAGDCVFVVAADPEAPWPEHLRLLADLVGEAGTITIDRFDRGQVRELVETLCGGAVSERCVRNLHRRSGGNVHELRELTLSGLADGALTDAHGVWEWTGATPAPGRLVTRMRAQLDHLDPLCRGALEVVAIADRVPLSLLPALLDAEIVDALDAIDRLERAGLVAVSAGGTPEVHLDHSLHGELALAAMSATRRCEHLAILADVMPADDPRTSARRTGWWLEAGVPVPVDELLAAGGDAHARGDTARALRFARAAVHAGGGARASFLVGVTSFVLGELDEARAALREAIDLAGARRSRLYPINVLAELEFDHGETAEVAEHVLDLGGDDVYVTARRALHALLGGDHLAALRLLDPVDLSDPGLLIGTVFTRSLGETMAGRADEGARAATAAIAVTMAAGREPHHPSLAAMTAARVFATRARGDLAAARAEATECYAAAAERDDVLGQAWHALLLGGIELDGGRCGVAAAWFRESAVQFGLARHPATRWAHAGQVIAAGRGGNRSAAETAAAALSSVLRSTPTCWRFLDHELARAQAWLAVATGDAIAARATLLGCLDEPWAASWLARLEIVGDLARLADPTDTTDTTGSTSSTDPSRLPDLHPATFADAVADRHRDGATDEPCVAAIVADHVASLRRATAVDLAAIGDRYEVVGAHGAAVDALVQAALCARAEGDPSATAHAARARVLAASLGCTPWSLNRLRRAVGLSPRQLEIATQVAAGASNAAIAGALFVSVRTVDNHVAATFVALAVRRRRDVASALHAWTGIEPT